MNTKTNSFHELLSRCSSVVSIPSDELVRLFREMVSVKEVKIGKLNFSTGFDGSVSHVIFLVLERGQNLYHEPAGNCVCVIIRKDGTMSYELSSDLAIFWPFWESKGDISFGDIPNVVDEISYFLKNGRPRTLGRHVFREGSSNQRLHRVLRSDEKCKQLNSVFRYQLVAGDG